MTFQSLDHPIRWLFLAHACAGALALGIFAIPLLSKKGGRVHIRTGYIYVFAMSFVALSAYIITPWRGFADPNRTDSSRGFALFLFFISTLTLCSIWFGLNVLKSKKRTSPDRSLSRIGPPILLILSGVFTQGVGYLLGNKLLMIFPFFGYSTGVSQIKYWSTVPHEKGHWWYAHMSGMGVACIATVTAFLVTALPRIWASALFESPLLWIAPGILGGTLLSRARSKYRVQFGDAK